MRTLPLGLIISLAASRAFAGVVTFDPALVFIDPAISTTAQVQVSVGQATTEDGTFDSVDLIIGSDIQGLIAYFTYDQEFIEFTPFRFSPQPLRALGTQVYGPMGSTFVGGFFNEPISAILVGTLILNATGVPNGEYTIGVDSARDGLSGMGLSGVNDSWTFGIARVVVIPEPGMAALLGVGLLVSILRHRDRLWRRRT